MPLGPWVLVSVTLACPVPAISPPSKVRQEHCSVPGEYSLPEMPGAQRASAKSTGQRRPWEPQASSGEAQCVSAPQTVLPYQAGTSEKLQRLLKAEKQQHMMQFALKITFCTAVPHAGALGGEPAPQGDLLPSAACSHVHNMAAALAHSHTHV